MCSDIRLVSSTFVTLASRTHPPSPRPPRPPPALPPPSSLLPAAGRGVTAQPGTVSLHSVIRRACAAHGRHIFACAGARDPALRFRTNMRGPLPVPWGRSAAPVTLDATASRWLPGAGIARPAERRGHAVCKSHGASRPLALECPPSCARLRVWPDMVGNVFLT